MNQLFRSEAQLKKVDIPAASQTGTNHLNSFIPISWATVKKNVLKIMAGSASSDGRLANRLRIYKTLLSMIHFRSIKAHECVGSSGDESLHIR